MVIHIYLNPSGYKFTNYGNWTKSWDLIQFDWLRYNAWNYQSSKSKDLISFPYTSTIYCILKRLALSPWSLSCVMVEHSYRVPIYYPYPRGKHRKESLQPTRGPYNLWHPPTYPRVLSTKRKIHYPSRTDQSLSIFLGLGHLSFHLIPSLTQHLHSTSSLI